MLESYKNDRIKFNKKGIQKEFILEAKSALGLNGVQLAKKLGISQRTLTDWNSEKLNMSYDGAIKLHKLSGIQIPSNFKIIKWKDHLKKIGKIGGKNRIKIYGKIAINEEYRNKKWREWWEKIGQFKENPKGFNSKIKIKIPKQNKKLAEFVGVMLGDGGIAPYHVHITLSSKEMDYASYITDLIYNLFNINPKVYNLKSSEAIDIVMQRKMLVDFCKTIGLVQGNKIKQGIDIPNWIKSNKEFYRKCIMGLVDTDGCFFINSYIVNGKKYFYLKIAFTSASPNLIKSVYEGLESFGIKARITKDKKDVRIEKSEYVLKYIKGIGSRNQKHLEKIDKWQNNKNMLK